MNKHITRQKPKKFRTILERQANLTVVTVQRKGKSNTAVIQKPDPTPEEINSVEAKLQAAWLNEKPKYKVGDSIRFDWGYNGTILSGRILQVKERRFRAPKYRVAYGIGDFGYKHTDSNQWVKEKDIFPGDVKLVPGKATK